MSEFCNYGGDGGGGIYCCSDKGAETKGVSVIGLTRLIEVVEVG